jgi:hypothetical protein
VSTPGEDLRHLFLGFRISQAIHAMAELSIADLMADGPKSAEMLASEAGAHAPSLRRVLRLLASEGVFTEKSDGQFALTPMAESLRRDTPGSLRTLVRFIGSETSWRSWGNLLHSVRTGKPSFDDVHGVDFFEYFRRHPDEWQLFDDLMTHYTEQVTHSLASAYDFSAFASVIDVGGGRGTLAIGLATAYPHLRLTVFDQPHVALAAQQAIEDAELAGRCQAVGGDFFTAVPEGGDAYILKWILHDWDDERCVAILSSCRQAMPPNGRLLVIELLIPPGNEPSFAKSQDVNMLVNLGGLERTEAEYRALYAAAGFQLTRTIPAGDELHIIEGVQAQ